MLNLVEHLKCFITSGLVDDQCQLQLNTFHRKDLLLIFLEYTYCILTLEVELFLMQVKFLIQIAQQLDELKG